MNFKHYAKNGLRFATEVFQTFGIMHLGFTYGYSFSYCQGPSMLPTINTTGDIVLIDHFSYHFRGKEFQRGDVIISTSPDDRNKNVCKRITAIEGDVVPVRADNSFFSEYIVVPKGCVWLTGDNIDNSKDSRVYGPVPTGLIHGRVFAKLSLSSQPFVLIPSDLPPNQKIQQQSKQIKISENN